MTEASKDFIAASKTYLKQLKSCFTDEVLEIVEVLAADLRQVWIEKRQVFVCGNGGSAANALHLANDLHYGIGACGLEPKIPGLRVEALSANTGIITCLANDTGYDNIYAHQLEVKARPKDLLIVLSGSGNSSNVVKAIEIARQIGLRSYAIVAFNGGLCKEKADQAIHFQVNDMQIAEDTQLVVGHICMQWLTANKPSTLDQSINGRN